ncbi:MAG: hypothetical protein JXR77_12905, partial [Lentisphaeria bacterium]|nr:hypothetical protein [Lentisphaeria bacterium]
LFGPVSISSDYHGLSQQLIVSFAKAGGRDTRLGVRIRPRTPFRSLYRKSYEMQLTRRVVKTLDDVSALVAAIENDGKGIPILLRQYLRLGGRILAFNRDPAFSNVLDALVLIDLTRSDGRLLARYMGEEGYAAFLEYHRGRLGRVPCPTPARDPSGRG